MSAVGGVPPTGPWGSTSGEGALPALETRGGVGGLDAQLEALEALAEEYDAVAVAALGWAGAAARAAADPVLVTSAPWSPGTFAVAEGALVALGLAPDGLLRDATAWTLQAAAVRGAAALVEEADRRSAELVAAVRHRVGYEVGHRVGAALRRVGLEEYLPDPHDDPTALFDLLGDDGGPAAPAPGRPGAVEAWALEHPDGVELLAGSAGGLVEGLWDSGEAPSPGEGTWALPTVGAATGAAAAGWFRRGTPVVAPVGGPVERAPARGVAGLVHELARVDALSAPGRPEGNGTIEVQRHGEGEQAAYVVLLPGTDDLLTRPDEQDGDVRDLATNLASLGGGPTAYSEGVAEALHAAGVPADAPVTVVGHSQGGIAALQVAASGEFDVRHVVTLGSPVALLPEVPDGVQVTSLENRPDVVPRLDGLPNPDRAHHLTVSFDAGGRTFEEAHGLASYAAGAAAVDAASDPVVAAQVDDLRAAGALGGDGPVTATTWQVTRGGGQPS